ncbi:MAG: bifunctional 4-hydroxy-3-methylbut-2-enyl diphosphate reductase/30S ribosomal protein S1 [Tissierellia bacterium]|nr:bifunctional 4-hydroxy-3-methylbut-2-enyl diphosphate reductase/30S ribosomal protein S1 [Tissierellia bacterium]
MKIRIADNAGFCFGVKRAVEMTTDQLDKSQDVYIKGDLVHNRHVVEKMDKLGLKHYEDYPDSKKVIIRSHGATPKVKNDIIEKNNDLIDCTCPVLLNIYKKIIKYYNEGYKIIIVGNRSHPEIIALNGYVQDSAIIVESEEEASQIKNQEKLYIISQTTNIYSYYKKISDIIVSNNKDVVVSNTICQATSKRQDSCVELSKRVDAMIVIGGLNSSNTKKLYELASKNCENTFWVESYENLDLNEFIKYNSIGITAGASTPGWIIEEVVNFMENYSKDEFMEQVEGSITKIYPKDIVKGEIIYVTDDEVIVNINYKSDGIVKLDELSTDPNVKPKDLFEEGQEIEVYVIKLDDGEGNVVLSTRRVEGLKNWQKLLKCYEDGENVNVTITKEVKGGLLGTTMGIVAFLPGSQITTYYVKDLKQFIGQEMECRIISADDKKRRLVVSRRVLEEEEQQKKIDEVWDTIEVDKVITGKVARLTDFGAFINLGGVDGLVHVSDISWNRIKHPDEVLTVGDDIDVIVLRKNKEKNRISLGYKQLMKKPFELFLEENAVGDIVKGTVVNLVDFGAFVRLKEGVEGLVHVSQISDEHVEKPSDELNLNDEIEVKILDIDPEEKRIALSIKETKDPEERKLSAPKEEVQRKPAPRRERREPKNEIEGFKNQELDTSIGALLEDFELSDEE